jgi:hypothetical protein
VKIEIDLNNIFADGVTTEEAIRREIVEILAADFKKRIKASVDDELQKSISQEILKQVSTTLAIVIPSMLDHEFTEVTSWGEKKATYTVRNRILKAIDDNTTFKKDSYGRGENSLSQVVDTVVKEQLRGFEKNVVKLIDEKFTKEAMEFAEKKLKDRLGIKS